MGIGVKLCYNSQTMGIMGNIATNRPGALKPSMVISVHKEGEISSLQSSFLWSHSQQTEMVEDITDDRPVTRRLVSGSEYSVQVICNIVSTPIVSNNPIKKNIKAKTSFLVN